MPVVSLVRESAGDTTVCRTSSGSRRASCARRRCGQTGRSSAPHHPFAAGSAEILARDRWDSRGRAGSVLSSRKLTLYLGRNSLINRPSKSTASASLRTMCHSNSQMLSMSARVFGSARHLARRGKVVRKPLSQVARLADIDHPLEPVSHHVDSRLVRHIAKSGLHVFGHAETVPRSKSRAWRNSGADQVPSPLAGLAPPLEGTILSRFNENCPHGARVPRPSAQPSWRNPPNRRPPPNS